MYCRNSLLLVAAIQELVAVVFRHLLCKIQDCCILTEKVMNKILLTLILVTSTVTLFGQTAPAFNSLLDTATKNSGLVISAYPVKKINLNLSDTFIYRDNLKYEYNYNIDSALLNELINNSKNTDTTKWTDSDLKNFVLVEKSDDYINAKNIIKKFSLTDKAQIKKVKRQIADFNDSHPFNRNIYYFSRPVFDKTKTYAIISHGNGNKGLMGRDYISLFHYDGNTWTNIGVMTRWIY